jgi:uncharacterized protein with ATP-grasp and redox domains
MKANLDCYLCIMSQVVRVTKQATPDEALQQQVFQEALRLVSECPADIWPPELLQCVYRLVLEKTGNVDPYCDKKQKANTAAMEIYPRLKDRVANASDPLLMACKLAIAGNSLDLFFPTPDPDPETLLDVALTMPFAMNDYAEFQAGLESTPLILYLGDNAGEVVFDRVLIEEIQKVSRGEVYFAVRGKPIFNDATLDDASFVGLDRVCTIISNGSDAPGTILRQCSSELRQLYNAAGLIVSKGGANLETLSEGDKNVFFFLRMKCPIQSDFLGAKLGDAVLMKRKPLPSDDRHWTGAGRLPSQ